MSQKNKYTAVATICVTLTIAFVVLCYQSRSILFIGIYTALIIFGFVASFYSLVAIDQRIVSAQELSEFYQKYPCSLGDLRKLTDDYKRPITNRDLTFLEGEYTQNEWAAEQIKRNHEQITQQFSKLPRIP